MNHCSKMILTVGLAVSLHLGLYPSTDVALSATAPVISVQPAITAGINTPARLARDSAGNIYATDPRAGGILKFSSAGVLLQKIVTPKSGAGIAIAQNGNILLTQGTYVVVLDPNSGTEISRFGTFTSASGIAIDDNNNAYVTDSKMNNFQKFSYNSGSNSYAWVATSGSFTDPVSGGPLLAGAAGIAFDKSPNKQLVIASPLASNITFFNPVTLTPNTAFGPYGSGSVGYLGYFADPSVSAMEPQFTYPQGVSLEYDAAGNLYRIYVIDTFQSNIQVLDGVTTNTLSNVGGGYGFKNGTLFSPSDAIFDQANKRILVANGSGMISSYGCDSTDVNYTLSVTTVGSGTVNGTISCGENTNCSALVASGTPVALTATANALTSTFAGWSGACTGTGTCNFSMTSDKSAVATFSLVKKQFFANGQYFDNLQAAYNVATDGSTIMIMAGTWPANTVGAFTAGTAKTVKLVGGYDSNFGAASAGNTTIAGRLNVKAGKIIMNNVRVK